MSSPSKKDTYHCIVLNKTIFLEPDVYWAPRSHGLQRRSHYFTKTFPGHNIVWVTDNDKWQRLIKEHPIQIYMVHNNTLVKYESDIPRP